MHKCIITTTKVLSRCFSVLIFINTLLGLKVDTYGCEHNYVIVIMINY